MVLRNPIILRIQCSARTSGCCHQAPWRAIVVSTNDVFPRVLLPLPHRNPDSPPCSSPSSIPCFLRSICFLVTKAWPTMSPRVEKIARPSPLAAVCVQLRPRLLIVSARSRALAGHELAVQPGKVKPAAPLQLVGRFSALLKSQCHCS